ncbi:MAG: hypothetical protein PHC56_04255 [Herbinix sp.]|nr:hypothetical protein [Herbinix sp.]
MKKIKSVNKPQQKAPMKGSTKILIYSLGGIVLLLAVILILIEGRSSIISIRNDSDIKLEYVKAYFVNMEGPVLEEKMIFENLESGDHTKLDLEKINLSYQEANLEIRFKFDGHDELFEDVGYFNEVFKGRINIDFKKTDEDGKLLLKVKAKNGVLPSPLTRCDEEHIINLTEGYVEE